MSLLIRNARLLLSYPEAPPATPLRGGAMSAWPQLDNWDVLVKGDRIAAVGKDLGAFKDARVVDAGGKVLMPGFVDCHTHACWAGNRLDEWEQKRAGVPYLEILKRGGGIMSTVRAVREAPPHQLATELEQRLNRMFALGSTTVEVKSGYGLSTPDEVKMLRAIAQAGRGFRGSVFPTALIAHSIDVDAALPAEFIRRTIDETLPSVATEFPGVPIDAYCEQGAWSFDDCSRLFQRAAAMGHPIRIHADQFNPLGIIELNTEWSRQGRGFRSIDHLEATDRDGLAALASTQTMGTLLPCTGFHTDGRYADGRAFIDAGGAAALATNANPGTSPCLSMQMAIALAVRMNKLSVHEAIAAATVNAAAVLGLTDRGFITPGARADLICLNTSDERQLAYEFGGNLVETIVAGGVVVDGGTC
jgi:imidazolonepropionase